MDEETRQRLEHLEQRINLLQASSDALAILIAQLIVGQSLQPKDAADLTPEQMKELTTMHLRAYETIRDRGSSKLSEFPFLPPDPPPP